MNTKKPPVIIGISGGSGSGKTYIAKKLKNSYQKGFVSLVYQDSFYKDLSHLTFKKRSEQNFDNPDAIDFELLTQVIKVLSNGGSTKIPIYDFTKHVRTNDFLDSNSRPIIILDGSLLYTQSKLLKLIDIKIYIDAPDELRLSRRIMRDTKERGRTIDSINKQYSESVRPMFDQYIAPSKKYADIVINSTKSEKDLIAPIKNEIDKNLN